MFLTSLAHLWKCRHILPLFSLDFAHGVCGTDDITKVDTHTPDPSATYENGIICSSNISSQSFASFLRSGVVRETLLRSEQGHVSNSYIKATPRIMCRNLVTTSMEHGLGVRPHTGV